MTDEPQHAESVVHVGGQMCPACIPPEPRIELALYRDNLTGKFQLSIEDAISGYRIHGPKFLGDSTTLLRHRLTSRDVTEIRRALALIDGDGCGGV